MDISQTGWPADDFGTALSAYLASRDTTPRLLGFGEAMHGAEELPLLRNTAFAHLVEQHGYGAIALESDCLAGLRIAEYLNDGGDLDAALREGFSHGFGEYESNRQLVDWMRRYRLRTGKRLRCYGFDAPMEMSGAQSPRAALTGLRDHLRHAVADSWLPAEDTIEALTGDDARWTRQEAVLDPSRSVGRRPEVARLRLLADDMATLLNAYAPALIAATSSDDWWTARMRTRCASGLLRYHAAMADDSPARLPRLMALRDAMMADNLLDIAERESAPVLVFAHNRHLQTSLSTWELAGQPLRWWSAGAIVSARLGAQYRFLASAVGSAPAHGLPEPEPETAEAVMSRAPARRFLFEASRLGRLLPAGAGKRCEPDANPGYFSLDPDTLDGADGVVFNRWLVD